MRKGTTGGPSLSTASMVNGRVGFGCGRVWITPRAPDRAEP